MGYTKECSKCGGSGKVACHDPHVSKEQCGKCHGTGRKTCDRCNGTGKVKG